MWGNYNDERNDVAGWKGRCSECAHRLRRGKRHGTCKAKGLYVAPFDRPCGKFKGRR